MFWSLFVTITSSILFCLLGWLFTFEAKVGHRVFLSRGRSDFDVWLTNFVISTHNKIVFLWKYIITLSWYYSLHTLLMLVLRFLAGLYFSVEKLLHRNRLRAKAIRSERRKSVNKDSHLTQIAEHQAETALTTTQKIRRKKRALEGK
ncbi:MAG: hypothetical protein COU68_02990 [Candidatus Pacebacteria bacterium CG10_big_fil_rev_8_21_14_0_10_45_6]|nr:MAG: hypothetical protein COU68_02990 [Candidatus Pacebacteria bacterium CG10_big_fil_rev_8_21_14_0_10_45_6]